MLFYAKKDPDIINNDQELKLKIQDFISSINKKYINKELFEELIETIKNNYYIEKFYQKITDNIDVTPEQIKNFYKKKRPYIPKKICISYITFYPKKNEINREKNILLLKKIKEEIHSDIDFSIKAILFSEDEYSNINGGLIKNILIDDLSKEFKNIILSLKEKEISNPFETKKGFHLIRLEKKRKNEIDIRHILIKHKYSKNLNKNKIKSFINLVKKRLTYKKIDFETICKEKNNIVESFFQKKICIEENQLSEKMKKILRFLKKGEITKPYKEIINGNMTFFIIKLLDIIPHHPVSFEKNYPYLEYFVKKITKKNKIKNWYEKTIKNTYTKINRF